MVSSLRLPVATAHPSPSPSPGSSPAANAALWELDGNTIAEFTTAQIAGGTVTPVHQITLSSANFPVFPALAFDRAGDLWVSMANLTINNSNNYSGQVVEFTSAQLAALATVPNPAPAVTVTIGGGAYGIAFDASGDLWVSVFAFSETSMQKFLPAQIATSGTPTPSIIVGGQPNGAIAFASDGTLWSTPISTYGPSGGFFYGLSPAQLTASASPSPAYQLSVSSPAPVQGGQLAITEPPNEIGFDSSGDLWSVFDGYYFEFAQSVLHASPTSPTIGFQVYPVQQSGGSSEVLPGYALAFDNAGNLITVSTTNGTASANTIDEFTSAQYHATSPTPVVARFGSSVPTSNGTIGDSVVAGPYVP